MAIAGDMLEAAEPPNANWRKCDGRYVINVNHPDYWRRVGFTHGGAGIGGMRLPDKPGWIICVTDEVDAPPTEPPTNVDVPHVSQEGAVLSCTMGNWTGTPDSYSYSWTINENAAGTDAATYDVQAGDIGGTAVCVVTATNVAGSTAAPPSAGLVVEDTGAAMRA